MSRRRSRLCSSACGALRARLASLTKFQRCARPRVGACAPNPVRVAAQHIVAAGGATEQSHFFFGGAPCRFVALACRFDRYHPPPLLPSRRRAAALRAEWPTLDVHVCFLTATAVCGNPLWPVVATPPVPVQALRGAQRGRPCLVMRSSCW
jgi:hypothetical protein